MNYLKPDLQGEEASVIQTILKSAEEVSFFIRHSPIVKLESFNNFGDQQLHQDVVCDEIVEKHLKANNTVKFFAS